jgi:hypothetical protein
MNFSLAFFALRDFGIPGRIVLVLLMTHRTPHLRW